MFLSSLRALVYEPWLMRLGDISVGYLYSLQAALTHLGHDPAPLFKRFRIDAELLATPQARISIPRFMRLGNAAIQLTGRPDIGLLMGRHDRPVRCRPDPGLQHADPLRAIIQSQLPRALELCAASAAVLLDQPL
jgi:hypothetical protein